jgi:hypothetical protein
MFGLFSTKSTKVDMEIVRPLLDPVAEPIKPKLPDPSTERETLLNRQFDRVEKMRHCVHILSVIKGECEKQYPDHTRVIRLLEDPEHKDALSFVDPSLFFVKDKQLVHYPVAKLLVGHMVRHTFTTEHVTEMLILFFRRARYCLFEELLDLIIAGGGTFDLSHIKQMVRSGAPDNEFRIFSKVIGIDPPATWTADPPNDYVEYRLQYLVKSGILKSKKLTV